MRIDSPSIRRLTLVLSCLLLAGCGSRSDLAKVQGTVTLNGVPLANATVEFQPVAEGGAPSSGQTDKDGTYQLMYTFDKVGATAGEHVVSVRTAGTYFDETGTEREREERVPAKYNDQSQLRRTVEPGRNTIDFEL